MGCAATGGPADVPERQAAARILGSIAAELKPVAALAAEFGIHRSTMCRELQALEEVGFARRLADGRFASGLQRAALGG